MMLTHSLQYTAHTVLTAIYRLFISVDKKEKAQKEWILQFLLSKIFAGGGTTRKGISDCIVIKERRVR